MPYWVALIHANLKQKDEAFRWFDKAYAERSGMLVYVDSTLALTTSAATRDLMTCCAA